jgi:hypothetical protein
MKTGGKHLSSFNRGRDYITGSKEALVTIPTPSPTQFLIRYSCQLVACTQDCGHTEDTEHFFHICEIVDIYKHNNKLNLAYDIAKRYAVDYAFTSASLVDAIQVQNTCSSVYRDEFNKLELFLY